MVEPERIAVLNDTPERAGSYVLYWMQQSQRAVFNPALEVAVTAANRRELPLVVAFALHEPAPHAQRRHYAFMLEGLADVARELKERGAAFVMRRGAPEEVVGALARKAALLVCDRGYQRRQRAWRTAVAAAAGCRVLEVEGDVVVPAALVSTRAEIGARSLRPKLARLSGRFLEPLRLGPALDPAQAQVLESLPLGRRADVVTAFRGGHGQARRRLQHFVGEVLSRYCAARSLPAYAQVSELSPYLHFGQISPVEIALAVRAARAPQADRDTYLEELIVRRELGVNFVTTTADYDSYAALPLWARRSLELHARDARAHLYGFEELAAGATHDPYWNAAMCEMRLTGFMHNYMRMYWGKKVLEWSASPEEGHATLLRLNNTYFLDGRDCSSYANVGWVFGLHDRPWPERAIFGNVRYMNAAGLERKTDIKDYVEKWLGAAAG